MLSDTVPLQGCDSQSASSHHPIVNYFPVTESFICLYIKASLVYSGQSYHQRLSGCMGLSVCVCVCVAIEQD